MPVFKLFCASPVTVPGQGADAIILSEPGVVSRPIVDFLQQFELEIRAV
jgi:hypothetical protein